MFENWTKEDWERWYAKFGEDFEDGDCLAGNPEGLVTSD